MTKTKILFIAYRGSRLSLLRKMVSNNPAKPDYLGTYPRSFRLTLVEKVEEIDFDKADAIILARLDVNEKLNIPEEVKVIFVLPPEKEHLYKKARNDSHADILLLSNEMRVFSLSSLLSDFSKEMNSLYEFLGLRAAKKSLKLAEADPEFQQVKEFLSL